jgi:hypothetical protein
MSPDGYDFVVVSAGSAGCIVAHRLVQSSTAAAWAAITTKSCP